MNDTIEVRSTYEMTGLSYFMGHDLAAPAPKSRPTPALRQGDVLLKRRDPSKIRDLPMRPSPTLVLALGEVTGHKHEVHGKATLLEETVDPIFNLRGRASRRFLTVKEESILKHEEHGPITLSPGIYEVEIQREYDPFEDRTRNVLD